MNRELLEKPFSNDLIKTRKGAFSQEIRYVEGAEYIKRLNDAFESKWSFEIIKHYIYDVEVVVIGRLVAGGISKTAFGGSNITTNKKTGEVVCLADDLKAAATDSLKKAASMLGIGLHMYSKESETSYVPGNANNKSIQPKAKESKSSQKLSKDNSTVTKAQLNAIYAIAKDRQISVEEINQRSLSRFEVVPEMLTKNTASALIQSLQKEPRQQRA